MTPTQAPMLTARDIPLRVVTPEQLAAWLDDQAPDACIATSAGRWTRRSRHIWTGPEGACSTGVLVDAIMTEWGRLPW